MANDGILKMLTNYPENLAVQNLLDTIRADNPAMIYWQPHCYKITI